jgi:hypothetical protein
MTVTTTINYKGKTFKIECWYKPYTPANFNGHPDTWYDAEGGTVEDMEVFYNDKNITEELSDIAIYEMQELAYESIVEDEEYKKSEWKFD